MAPQLSQVEREEIRRLAGRGSTPAEILKTLTSLRSKPKLPAPDLTSFRRAMRGKTHRQDVEEACGRPRKHTRRNVLKMEKTRKQLIAKAGGEYGVHWNDVKGKTLPTKMTVQKCRDLNEDAAREPYRRHNDRN